jgi:iron(III) transport system substrate-binding protein
VYGAIKNGWVVDPVGRLFAKEFDRKTWMFGKSFIVGTAILGQAWNNQAYTAKVSGVSGLHEPRVLGQARRAGSARVDLVHGLVSLGRGQVRKGHPAEARRAEPEDLHADAADDAGGGLGEIAGAPCAAHRCRPERAGRPIDYNVLKDNWNAPYYGLILKQAPHPAAAQLLADYLISPEGERVCRSRLRRPLPEHRRYVLRAPAHRQAERLPPAKVAAFNAQWVSLFVH